MKKNNSLIRATIQSIIEWIESNISNPMPIKVLSDKSGYSAGHFQKSFKKITGMTPKVYITYRKMIIAKELLAETHSSITEITMYLGYAQQPTFSKVFREYYRITPTQYRLNTHTVCAQE